MPLNARTLSWTKPRILPAVVFATGPCVEPSLAFAASALFHAPPRMLLAPIAAPLTKDRRLILVCMILPSCRQVSRGPFYTFDREFAHFTPDERTNRRA